MLGHAELVVMGAQRHNSAGTVRISQNFINEPF